MRSPVPEPPASPIMYDSPEELTWPESSPLSTERSVTPMAHDFGPNHRLKLESAFDIRILPSIEVPLAMPVPNQEFRNYLRTSLVPHQPPILASPRRFPSEMSLVRDEEQPQVVVSRRVVETVHRICLEVTQEYIGDFKRYIEIHRRGPLNHSPITNALAPRIVSLGETLFAFVYQHARATDSFRNNISTVCSILWAQGNQGQTLCPTSEREAANLMSYVIDAAEHIMAAQHKPNYGSRDWTVGVLMKGVEFCKYLRKFGSRDAIKRVGVENFGANWDGA